MRSERYPADSASGAHDHPPPGLVKAGAVAGLAVGTAGAFALRGVLANEIYGVSALDPLVIGSAALLLATVVCLASAIPARRAARVHPVRALNQA